MITNPDTKPLGVWACGLVGVAWLEHVKAEQDKPKPNQTDKQTQKIFWQIYDDGILSDF